MSYSHPRVKLWATLLILLWNTNGKGYLTLSMQLQFIVTKA